MPLCREIERKGATISTTSERSSFYIKALTSPKALICDPFLGSGTTACAVASLGQGRRFWAAEIDPETCKIARNRVAAELRSVGGKKTLAAKVATQ